MSFYVLEADKEQAEKLHKFVLEMKAKSIHLIVQKRYSRAEEFEKKAQRAISELRELENKRIDSEQAMRQQERLDMKKIVSELVSNGVNAEVAIFKGRKAQ